MARMFRTLICALLVVFTACGLYDDSDIGTDAGQVHIEACTMGNLPFSRNTTYAAGSQLEADDLNDMQDVEISSIGDLILGLGGTTSNDLNDLIQNGTFTPDFDASPTPAFTFGSRFGCYQRIGEMVTGMIVMSWTNGDATFDAEEVQIIPPYAPAATFSLMNGALNYVDSNLGAQNADFTTASPILENDNIKIQGRPTTMASTVELLLYGNDARHVTLFFAYRTDGTFNY